MGRRLRRWPNIKPTPSERLVFSGRRLLLAQCQSLYTEAVDEEHGLHQQSLVILVQGFI